MPIDRGFDFFRMDLETADVDDAAPPPEEVVPIVATFHDIAGIDKPFVVCQRGGFPADVAGCAAWGPNPQRAVDNLDLHIAGRADHVRRKPLEAVVHLECHARFGRRECMADARLIGDFSR